MTYYNRRRKNNSIGMEGRVAILLSLLVISYFYTPLNSFIYSIRYVYLILFLFLFGFISYSIYKHHELSKAGIFEIDKMTGTQFEKYLYYLFSTLGYKTKHTGKIGDLGSDLTIEKDGIKIAIQAKRYNGYVGPDAVREINTAIKPLRCNYGMVVSNNFYTSEAKYLAKENNVTLWDRNELIKNILKIKK